MRVRTAALLAAGIITGGTAVGVIVGRAITGSGVATGPAAATRHTSPTAIDRRDPTTSTTTSTSTTPDSPTVAAETNAAPAGTPPSGVSGSAFVVTNPAPTAPATCPDPDGASLAEGILNGHNAVRCQNGLGQLTIDPEASAHAQFHAERLMAAGACSALFHSSELGTWYITSAWGENAACVAWAKGCWSGAPLIMDGWMASPEHRPNVLGPTFRYLGIGIACDGQHTYVVTQFHS